MIFSAILFLSIKLNISIHVYKYQCKTHTRFVCLFIFRRKKERKKCVRAFSYQVLRLLLLLSSSLLISRFFSLLRIIFENERRISIYCNKPRERERDRGRRRARKGCFTICVRSIFILYLFLSFFCLIRTLRPYDNDKQYKISERKRGRQITTIASHSVRHASSLCNIIYIKAE